MQIIFHFTSRQQQNCTKTSLTRYCVTDPLVHATLRFPLSVVYQMNIHFSADIHTRSSTNKGLLI